MSFLKLTASPRSRPGSLSSELLLGLLDLAYFPRRCTASKLGTQPDSDQRGRDLRSHHPSTEGQDLRVVGGAGLGGGVGVMRHAGVHTRDLVGCDRHPDAGSTDKNRAIVITARDRVGNEQRDVGIIDWVRGRAAVVLYAVSLRLEVLLELLFEVKAGIVAADCDGLSHLVCACDCELLEVDLG